MMIAVFFGLQILVLVNLLLYDDTVTHLSSYSDLGEGGLPLIYW